MEAKEDSFKALFGAIGNASLLTALGFALRKGGLASSRTKVELGSFATSIALPSQVVKELVGLRTEEVALGFFVGCVLAKIAIAGLIFGLTMMLDKSGKNRQRSGIFAMFCTQSNDLAIGLPIVDALFGSSNPNFPVQLYIIAPFQFAVITSCSLLALESQHIPGSEPMRTSDASHERDDPGDASNGNPASSDGNHRSGAKDWSFYIGLMTHLASNPIILSTAVAMLLKLILARFGGLPTFLSNLLGTVGKAFPATVLLSLGMSISELQSNGLRGVKAAQSFLLVASKLIIMPVACSFIAWFSSGSEKEAQLAFLYGQLPSAPIVPIFAQQFGIDEELVAISSIICLGASLPLISITGLVILLQRSSVNSFFSAITTAKTVAGCASALGDAICFGLYFRRCAIGFIFHSQRAAHRLPAFLSACHLAFLATAALRRFSSPFAEELSPPYSAWFQTATIALASAAETNLVIGSSVVSGLCVYKGLERSGWLLRGKTLVITSVTSLVISSAVVAASLMLHVNPWPLREWYPLGSPALISDVIIKALLLVALIVCLLGKQSVGLHRHHTVSASMASLAARNTEEEEGEEGDEVEDGGNEQHSSIGRTSSGQASWDWQVLRDEGSFDREPFGALRRLMRAELWVAIMTIYSGFGLLTNIASQLLFLIGSGFTSSHLAVELVNAISFFGYGVPLLLLIGRGTSEERILAPSWLSATREFFSRAVLPVYVYRRTYSRAVGQHLCHSTY